MSQLPGIHQNSSKQKSTREANKTITIQNKTLQKGKKYKNDIQASISRAHLPFLLKVSMARKKIEGSTLLSAEEVAHKKRNANTCQLSINYRVDHTQKPLWPQQLVFQKKSNHLKLSSAVYYSSQRGKLKKTPV